MDKGVSAIDLALRRMMLLSKMFTNSWGKPEILQKAFEFRRKVMAKGTMMDVVQSTKPKMTITKTRASRDGSTYMEGHFLSPIATIFPDLMPGCLGLATWRGLFSKRKKALVIHLAGTGDHTYYRREFGFANDLLKSDISSVLLQNPFYGFRKPKDQFRSCLMNVTDLFVMGGALVAECNFLLKWAKDEGYWPLGLAGVSMGGFMASLACTNWPEPVSLTPCLSWTTASTVFVKGIISKSISWDVLAVELLSEKFRKSIWKIPGCDWLERAADMERRVKKRTPFTAAKCFMYVLMEEFTNIANFPMPKDTTLIKTIIAENDGYVIREGVPTMEQLWPGSNVEVSVRLISPYRLFLSTAVAAFTVLKNMGHVEAYFASHAVFRESIREMLARNEMIYGKLRR